MELLVPQVFQLLTVPISESNAQILGVNAFKHSSKGIWRECHSVGLKTVLTNPVCSNHKFPYLPIPAPAITDRIPIIKISANKAMSVLHGVFYLTKKVHLFCYCCGTGYASVGNLRRERAEFKPDAMIQP